ncbi:diaminopimelate epimerase [Streptomyces sp. NBC_01565]|uniref:diaminopimelate epimerase n=1 Tax=unclassified Streptomyces TaxID=2593676 RepID=UPI00225BB22F|nr:diaminopimelate epimerase [Streptomyces sp. NBC_01565]MCX4542446.1 diaminopimelate epimerase [Streptomyces sp. NBC_01565]
MYDFAKYEALGNDYIVIDPRHTTFDPTPENVRLVCDRHHGLGGDGVLYGPLPAADGFRLRTFNADGTECEKSGNGLRIFARYLRDSGHTDADAFVLHPPAGPCPVRILDAESAIVGVGLGAPALEGLREPLTAGGATWTATRVDLGNPHCVIETAPAVADEALARRLGPAVRDHALFPDRTNVELLDVLGPDRIRIEIFERGAGYTLASGSSACAAAVAAHALGLTGPRVTVEMPGGRVTVEIDAAGRVSLTGEVRAVLRGHWAPGTALRLARPEPAGDAR